MSITILKPGVANCFYDEGRHGHQQLGINAGGVMDMIAMKTANALTLNNFNQAVLEMHFPAAKILFNTHALIALSGADFMATINYKSIPVNRPVLVKKNSILHFSKPLAGARLYLSVRGGFKLINWMDSYSTNLTCKAGGYKGRALQAGDVVAFNEEVDYTHLLLGEDCRVLPFTANVQPLYQQATIGLLPGPHYPYLTQQSRQQLIQQPFTISADSNRMGYRLQATPLALHSQLSIVSSAVTKGTLQLLPGGQLILLMADHQTTGGYPIIAHVTSTHIPGLAQHTTGANIRFHLTTIPLAEAALLARHRHLLQLQNACNLRVHEFINPNSRP